MIKAIAIDDEPLALQVIQNHAEKIPFLALKEVFTNPVQAMEYLSNQNIDLIFLDIRMPDLSGIDFLATINRGDIAIVFTTAYSEYAIESYEVNAVDYLLKPFDFPRFLTSMYKVKERLVQMNKSDSGYFFVNTGYQQRKIFFDDILYIKGDGNYIIYFTKKEKILVRSTIKETIQSLPSSLFVQVHRSYIIFLKQIDKIEDNHIYIEKNRISIGASFKQNLMSRIGLK